MALRDIFKKEKPKKDLKKDEKIELTDESKDVKLLRKKEKIISSDAYRILKSPHISERATDLLNKNQYVFKVWKKANKNEIKKAIEEVYNIDVLSVKIINIPPKKRRLGRISGWRRGYKKAIVKIKEGQKIEVLPR